MKTVSNFHPSWSQEQCEKVKKTRLALLAKKVAGARMQAETALARAEAVVGSADADSTVLDSSCTEAPSTRRTAMRTSVRKPRLMPLPKPWADKSADEIMKTCGPKKTSHLYDIAWERFQEFRGSSAADEPDEHDYLKYFDYLREGREFKASTLWCTYGKLNSVHQRKYGKKLQLWPRIKLLLNGYQQGYERKTASIFTLDQIKAALQLPHSNSKWVMWKAVTATAYCGGLRGIEARSITQGNVHIDEEGKGIWMSYYQGKQKGEVKKNRFLVPFGEPVCFGTHVRRYLDLLRQSLPDLNEEDPLFLRPTKSGFCTQPMGENQLGNIGKQLAKELGLPNPSTFTGHCFRRSAATAAASNGATSVMMKGQFGWVQEATALKYIDVTNERPIKMAEIMTGAKITPQVKDITTKPMAQGGPVTTPSMPSGTPDGSIAALALKMASTLSLSNLVSSATVTMESPSGEKISIHVHGSHFNINN